MPLYSVSLRQSWDIVGTNRRKWSNVFFKEAPNATAAAAWGVGAWVADLRNASRTACFCYEVYATSVTEGDDDYAVQTVPQGSSRGSIGTPGTDAYFAPVCISVTIQAESGRPSRKFWRPGLFEGDISGGQTVVPTLIQAIEGAFSFFVENAVPADPDGQILQGGVVARLTRRNFGRESTENLPQPPPQG
jgi:hypothetical protein